jgi:hypothetical protein
VTDLEVLVLAIAVTLVLAGYLALVERLRA